MRNETRENRWIQSSVALDSTYGVSFVVGAVEMGHAIQTRKGCAATLAAVQVEFLFGQDITTALRADGHVSLAPKAASVPNEGYGGSD